MSIEITHQFTCEICGDRESHTLSGHQCDPEVLEEEVLALRAQVDEMKWHKWRNDPRDTGRIAVMDKPKSVWNDYGAYYKVKETEAYFAEQEAQIAALQTELAEAENYATNLANVLYEKHWSHQTEWELLPNLIGVLTQIDNMTAGLSQGESHD